MKMPCNNNNNMLFPMVSVASAFSAPTISYDVVKSVYKNDKWQINDI